MADRGAAEWLERLAEEGADLDWDEGNRGKLRKHHIDREEVESIFGAPIVFAGRIAEPKHDEPRA